MAVGFELHPASVLAAYRGGAFPWFPEGMPVLWWSPDPRALLPLDGGLHVSRSLARTIRRHDFTVRLDTAFDTVMAACDENRPDGSWIHDAMRRSYGQLHRLGHAHSLEVWRAGELVGGVYGVAFGACFAAESMFHRERDMSKVALVELVRHLRARGYESLDVQFQTEHLDQFGCYEVPRAEYLTRVRALRDASVTFRDR